MIKTAIFSLLILLFNFAYSQEQKSIDTSYHHSVKLATIFSAVLPGAGQVYNHLAMPKGKKKAFWKIPIIYAGIGATGFFLLKNNSLKNDYKNEYKNRAAGLEGKEEYQAYDDQAILSLYDLHLRRRDLFIVGFSAAYILQILDATVEAHFVEFDISEDLSLKIEPTFITYKQAGIKLSLNFVK